MRDERSSARYGGIPGISTHMKSEWFAVGLIVAYAGLLALRYDSVPGGLCNDAVQETQTGYNAVFRDGFPVMAFDPHSIGIETLWAGVAGVLVRTLGHESLAICMSSWLAIVLMLVMLLLFARRHRRDIDPALLVLVAISMPWVFHYGRSGLRAASAGMFMAADLAALSMFVQKPYGLKGPIALGCSLAMGVYAYTSLRVPPLSYALFAAIQVATAGPSRKAWCVQHAKVVATALLVSLPNIVYAIREPGLFFGRGTYNVVGSAGDRIFAIVESAVLPLWYDSARYTTIVGTADGGVRWIFDAVATALPLARIAPVPVLIGIAMLAGMTMVPTLDKPTRQVATFGLLTYGLTAVLIGFMGPSQTRLSILMPIVALFAAIALQRAARFWPPAGGLATAALVAVLGAFSIGSYFQRMPRGVWARPYAVAAMAAGRAARELAAGGAQVLVVVAKDRNTVEYFTASQAERVDVVEFYRRPFDPADIDRQGWHPDAVVVSLDPAGDPAMPAATMLDAARHFNEAYEQVAAQPGLPFLVYVRQPSFRNPSDG